MCVCVCVSGRLCKCVCVCAHVCGLVCVQAAKGRQTACCDCNGSTKRAVAQKQRVQARSGAWIARVM